MADTQKQSPIQQARRRMTEADRQQSKALSSLIPRREQGGLAEEDAKRIAAALTEMMKR